MRWERRAAIDGGRNRGERGSGSDCGGVLRAAAVAVELGGAGLAATTMVRRGEGETRERSDERE
jgi:hypothetical protein